MSFHRVDCYFFLVRKGEQAERLQLAGVYTVPCRVARYGAVARTNLAYSPLPEPSPARTCDGSEAMAKRDG